MKLVRALACLWLVTLITSVYAEDVPCPEADCATVGEWQFGLSIGAGQRSNPLHDGDDIPLRLIPRVSYYGERFFLENLELGYTLLDQPALMINAIATPGYDRMFFSRWDPNNVFVDLGGSTVTPSADITSIELAGLRKRRLAYLAGVEFSAGADHYEWQLQVLSDISGVHDGQEARLGLSLMTEAEAWRLAASLGLTWKSAALVDYYYGIQTEEVSDGRSLYRGRATLNPFVKLSLSRPLNENWQGRLHWHYEQLGGGITDSPIVETDHVTTLFLGVDYHF